MNATKQTTPQLDYFMTPVSCPGGGERYVALGFSRDGNMWIDPGELGIGPEYEPKLARYGANYLLPDYENQTVLMNCRAIAEVIDDPFARREWLEYVEDMIEEHKKVRAKYDASRKV
jgi:hypothetical protein